VTTDQQLDVVFSALADPTRRKIVERLGSRPHRAGELAEHLGTSAPVISRHLRILLRAEIVEDERVPDDARVRLFHLRTEPVTTLQAWVDRLEPQWDEQLAGFKAYAEVRAPAQNPRTKPTKGARR
jgi:DNA-binding transcriptional ArsR family regulator